MTISKPQPLERPAHGASTLAAPIAAVCCLVATLATPVQAQKQQVPWPQPIDLGLVMMEIRAGAQQQSLWKYQVDHDFNFRDRRAESGIRFEHQIVDDAAKAYKPVHYDHGSGVVVADFDGDSLYDIYFVNQRGSNELWKNLGGGRFTDITRQAGVALEGRIQVTASSGDIDNDGDPDLYVTTARMGNVLFQNDGQGRFTDITKEAGLEHTGHSSGSVFFDYDLDGNLDLFVTNVGVYTTEERGFGGYYVGFPDAFSGHLFPERTETSILYRNLGGGRFQDVSRETGLVDGSWSGDASFSDVNADGYPDLYVLNMQGDDHYYENVGGRTFVDRTAERFPTTPWGSMGIKFFDYNNDGLQDLYLTDMHSDMSREVTPGFEKLKSLMTWDENHLQDGSNNIFGNAFYRNLGSGRFEEISDRIGAENYWPWGLSAADLNADGWEDVFIASSMNFPYRYGVNSVLLNNRGESFLDSEFLLGVEPRKDNQAKKPWFDVDCGGPDAGHFLCGGLGAGNFTILGNLGSRSSVIFDLDDDGDLDIVTNEFNDRPQVLISDLAERRPIHYVKVKLVGSKSNRDGLGATVRVQAGSRTLTRFHDGKSGYLSQSSLPLYIGLGDAEAIDRVTVTWPSGTVQTIEKGLEINSLIEIVEAPPGG